MSFYNFECDLLCLHNSFQLKMENVYACLAFTYTKMKFWDLKMLAFENVFQSSSFGNSTIIISE